MADAKQKQLRRGTAVEHNEFTGAIGEVTVNTTDWSLHVHDGSTVSGHKLALLSSLNDLQDQVDAIEVAALLGYPLFDSIPDGLAGTSDGGTFSVNDGEYLNLYQNDGGTELALGSIDVVKVNYDSRSDLVSSVSSGDLNSLSGGRTVSAGGLVYQKMASSHPLYGTNPIPDMPGWAPVDGGGSVLHFGAVGDGATDDTDALEAALLWWISVDRYDLEFPGGDHVYRMSRGVFLDFNGGRIGRLFMNGPIRPDAASFDAITFYNGWDGEFHLSVNGGGITSDMSQKDPVGLAQAFVISGIRGGQWWVKGFNYKGRVLRTTWDKVSLKTSKNIFNYIETGGDATAQFSCGQAFFFEGSGAFGTVISSWTFWDDYGPVFERCFDVSLEHLESGWKANSGLEIRGCGNFWFSKLALGDETQTLDLLTVKDSDYGGGDVLSSYSITVEKLFGLEGRTAVKAQGIGKQGIGNQPGLFIGEMHTRNSGVAALELDDVSNSTIGEINARGCEVAVYCSGGDIEDCDIGIRSINVNAQAILSSRPMRNVKFRGSSISSNHDVNAGVSTVELTNSVTDVTFLEFTDNSPNAASNFKLPISNQVKIKGGAAKGASSVFASGGFGSAFLVDNLDGYVNYVRGQATILSGNSTVTVTHGMNKDPDKVFLQERNSDTNGQNCRPSTFTDTTFVIRTKSGANVAADSPIDYEAYASNAL